MSNHISHNDPKHECATPAVSKHNITPKDLERGGYGCGCHQQDLNPSRLDQVIAQYEAMKEEAAAAKERFIQAALGFDIHLEPCTDEEIYKMFNRNNH